MFLDPAKQLEALRREDRTDAENRGRTAQSLHTVELKGIGTTTPRSPVRFDVEFIEEPFFFSGSMVKRESGGSPPIALSSVRAWQRNSRGMYIGAFMVYVVQVYTATGGILRIMPSPAPIALASLMFQGIAVKSMARQGQELELMEARAVNS